MPCSLVTQSVIQRPEGVNIPWEFFQNIESQTTQLESILTRSPADSFRLQSLRNTAVWGTDHDPTCQYPPNGRKISSDERILEVIQIEFLFAGSISVL